MSVFLNEPADNEERKRRLRASSSARAYKDDLIRSGDDNSVEAVLTDTDLTEQEKALLIDKATVESQAIFRNRLNNCSSDKDIFKIAKELKSFNLLTKTHKDRIVNFIRGSIELNLKFKGSDALDHAMNSSFLLEKEKTEILFSLNEVTNGKFKLKKNMTLEKLLEIINEKINAQED